MMLASGERAPAMPGCKLSGQLGYPATEKQMKRGSGLCLRIKKRVLYCGVADAVDRLDSCEHHAAAGSEAAGRGEC